MIAGGSCRLVAHGRIVEADTAADQGDDGLSADTNDPEVEQSGHEAARVEEAVGVEIGKNDDEGSTFEPEEDTEAQAD